jgi:alginate O-acetyltransferase complex protein AlgI
MTSILPIYSLFLLGVLGIYWLVGSLSLRLWVLLVASLIFYATLQIQYIPLLLLITLINFALGKAIGANTAPERMLLISTSLMKLGYWLKVFGIADA